MPEGSPSLTGAPSSTAPASPRQSGRPPLISQRSLAVLGAAVAAFVAAHIVEPGVSQAAEGPRAAEQAEATPGERFEEMKKAAFREWSFNEHQVASPQLLSAGFLSSIESPSRTAPIGPFIRTSEVEGLLPQDEIPLDQVVKVEEEIKFIFAVFVPKGQEGMVKISWDCNGQTYEGSRHVGAHDIGGVESSNGYRLHDTARFPTAGTWTAHVTFGDQELGSFSVRVEN